MRKSLSQMTIFVAIVLLVWSLSCTDAEKQAAVREARQKQSEAAQREYARQQELNRQAERVEAMRTEAEEMLRGLQEKEVLLHIKQSELDSLGEQLELKETELILREEAAEKTKRTGQWLLFIGIVLILISLFLFMKRSRRQEEVKPSALSGDLSDEAAAADALMVKQTTEAEAAPAKAARTRRKPAAKAPQAEGEKKETKPTSRTSRKKTEPKSTADNKDAAENKEE